MKQATVPSFPLSSIPLVANDKPIAIIPHTAMAPYKALITDPYSKDTNTNIQIGIIELQVDIASK